MLSVLLRDGAAAQSYEPVANWPSLPAGRQTLGQMHGDIAVSSSGDRVPPEEWRTGYVVAPHGVAIDARGNLFVAEFSTYRRVHKFNRR